MQDSNLLLEELREHVRYLQTIPVIPQRHPLWFNARYKSITASEAACCLTLSEEMCKAYVNSFDIKDFKYKPDKCLSHYDNKEDYIINKCRGFYGENLFKDSVFTLHGKKFEEIATRLYRKEYNTKVLEFGLLQHPDYDYIAASPDGITPDGIMLEIKCPYSRKIDGKVPIWYWTQIMHQLESTDLDECHFLECQINELFNESLFIQQTTAEFQDKGILLNRVNEPDNSEIKYIYPPDNLNTHGEFIEWSNDTILKENSNGTLVVPIYYFINKWAVISVKRQKEWFSKALPYYKETIDIIRKFQNDFELFSNYRQSVFNLRNEKYIKKYNDTTCLINEDSDSDSEFIIQNKELYSENESEVCMID